VVTNSHVVRNVERIKVTLKDGQEIIGEVLGADEDTDLAVVQILSKTPLAEVKFGDSSKVRVGQLVVAVGNPYGLNDTTTFGIVSGLKRENINLSRYEDFIQTDASINPGNSGGPLLNIKGEVIGINTAIINYAQSIGFSIPSNMVKHVVEQLVEHGEVHRGWLGVGIDPVSEEVANRAAKAQVGEGVIINSIFEGDPADMAGLKVGDIILKIGGSEITSPNSMIRVIGAMTPGQTINLDILRKGKHSVVPVKLESRKRRTTQLATLPPMHSSGLGFTVANSEKGSKLPRGALVSQVSPQSPAALNGLRSGDLIVAVNGETVENQHEFDGFIGKIPPGSPIFLLVWRNDKKFHLGLVREK
jgi:serine protease Do